MKPHAYLLCFTVMCFLLMGCGKEKKPDYMPEMERLNYENTIKKLNTIYAEASEAANCDTESAMFQVREELRQLDYDFNGDNMGVDARKKCQELKNRIDALKANPELAFNGAPSAGTGYGNITVKGSKLIARNNMKISGVERFAYGLNAGDNLTISLDCQGAMQVDLYDVNRQKLVKRFSANGTVNETIPISEKGIYVVELQPSSGNVGIADVALSVTGKDATPRPRIREKLTDCSKGDFMAQAVPQVKISKVFREPKKVGLRGNLKAMFSGKSRVVIPVHVPAGCDLLLYSLRISTNENTVSSDGKFAENLSVASRRIKIFGKTIYERQSLLSSLVNTLLLNTRPPREEDAFCNMYVLTSSAQAKKFQDETSSSGHYKYDVGQSQLGTQSCNGRLNPKGHKTIYLGIENERMRYDNYIWLEVAAINYTTKYVKPVYLSR